MNQIGTLRRLLRQRIVLGASGRKIPSPSTASSPLGQYRRRYINNRYSRQRFLIGSCKTPGNGGSSFKGVCDISLRSNLIYIVSLGEVKGSLRQGRLPSALVCLTQMIMCRGQNHMVVTRTIRKPSRWSSGVKEW